MIDLKVRGAVFVLDYALLLVLTYYSNELLGSLTWDPTYLILLFYSIVFVLFEHRFDGSIFKVLLKLKSVSSDGEKLELKTYLLKFLLRPITFVMILFYLWSCLTIILWLFGIQRPLFRYLRGEIKTLWYDPYIDQVVIRKGTI